MMMKSDTVTFVYRNIFILYYQNDSEYKKDALIIVSI